MVMCFDRVGCAEQFVVIHKIDSIPRIADSIVCEGHHGHEVTV